jgi:cyclophilin family peptidyl-prolyl cis-trans isomerase/predicted DsbA family dithiol-disulfide isomerase
MTIIEYSDFQSPACASITPVLEQFLNQYPDDVRLVFRHFPLIGTPERPIHDKAALAAQAAEAAGLQGMFWEMHDQLFSRQEEWVMLSHQEFRTWLGALAAEMALDVSRFHADMDSEQLASLVKSAWDSGLEIGLPGTPFILINGKPWDFNVPLTNFNLSVLVKLTLLENRQFATCPSMTIDPDRQYIVTLKTEKGDIVLELFPNQAPLAVNNFVFLIRNGWYDHVMFHRVIPNYIAQAGDPSGTGYGGPGYAFENEIVAALTFDREGLLGMANAGEGSNGSQFFITYGPAENLNGRYTIFGQVITGMEVVRNLTPRNTDQNADLPPGDLILAATVEEK